MLNTKLLKSALFLGLLFTLASCYTRFGVVRVEPVEEEYGYEGEPAPEEIYENDVVVYRHVYINRYYHPGHFYFDPYDAWYFEPGVYFSFGYYSGPVVCSPAYYYPPYYGHPVYVYSPYIYYPPYWHPVYYPVPYPVYYPVPYYGGGHGPHYAYTPKPLKRRNFGKRTDTAIASNKTLTRRGSGSQLTRRTVSTGDNNSGGPFNRRISSGQRRNYTPDPQNGTYKRQIVRKRSDNSGTSLDKPAPSRRNDNSETKKTYSTKRSYGNSSSTGDISTKKKSSQTRVSGETRKSYAGYNSRSSKSSQSSAPSKVTRSTSRSRTPSVSSSRSSGSTSSSRASVTRSSSGSRSSSPSRSVSSGSSRSSGSSKSSSRSVTSRRR